MQPPSASEIHHIQEGEAISPGRQMGSTVTTRSTAEGGIKPPAASCLTSCCWKTIPRYLLRPRAVTRNESLCAVNQKEPPVPSWERGAFMLIKYYLVRAATLPLPGRPPCPGFPRAAPRSSRPNVAVGPWLR